MTGIENLEAMARFVVRNFELSPNLTKNMVTARMDRDWDWLDELVAKAYLNEVENLVYIYEHFNEGKHYSINIKVHSLDLTDEQVSLLLDSEMKLLRHFQEMYIAPWIDDRQSSNKPDIGVNGRSGGWLCLGRSVLEKNHAEAYDAKAAYEEVREFREEWDALFEEMKRELDTAMEEAKAWLIP